jgi:nucleotide-binding universal stress UspA family protein
MAGEIVLGYDGSGGADAALEVACDFAKRLERKLVIVFAYEVSAFGGEVQDLARALRERGEAVTARAAASAKEAGLEPEIAIAPGKQAEAIARLASDRDALMIVVGSNGESALKGIVLGSVPQKLLHIAEEPLLVVPHRGDG